MTFPAILPDAQRTFTPGLFGGETYAHGSGVEVRFLTSLERTADQLQLLYDLQNETTVNLFLEHYLDQEGGTLPFQLSTEATAGFPTGDTLATAGYQWVYVSPPEIEHAGPGLFRITISLEAINVDATVTDGSRIQVGILFTPGAAAANSEAAGMDETVTASISAGEALANTVIVWRFDGGRAGGGGSGADLTIDLTVDGFGGGGGGSGFADSVAASLVGGAATGA